MRTNSLREWTHNEIWSKEWIYFYVHKKYGGYVDDIEFLRIAIRSPEEIVSAVIEPLRRIRDVAMQVSSQGH